MASLFRILVWLILLGAAATAAALWLALDEAPLVRPHVSLSPTDAARAKRILRENDPRATPAGSERSVRILQRDLNLAANFLLMGFDAGVSIDLRPGTAHLSGSFRLPDLPSRPFLNLSLEFSMHGGARRVSGLRVGRIPVPDVISRLLVEQAAAYVSRTEQGRLAAGAIQDVKISADNVTLTYRIAPDLVERVRALVTTPRDHDAIQAYYSALAGLHRAGEARSGPLLRGVRPLFQLARERALASPDPVVENRALLAVLGAWSAGEGMDRLIPDGSPLSRPEEFRLTLNGRTDLAQHFLVSAALSSRGTRIIAEAIGLYKELEDARGGSGFSFTDLAADRAGARFGALATESSRSARRLQESIADGAEEQALFPDVDDLPAPMNAASFRRRYGAVGSPAYEAVAEEIDRRIAACALYLEQ